MWRPSGISSACEWGGFNAKSVSTSCTYQRQLQEQSSSQVPYAQHTFPNYLVHTHRPARDSCLHDSNLAAAVKQPNLKGDHCRAFERLTRSRCLQEQTQIQAPKFAHPHVLKGIPGLQKTSHGLARRPPWGPRVQIYRNTWSAQASKGTVGFCI